MERYDLRACFLPDLSGLHVRIYQFRELLRQSLPVLSNHMEDLQVDPAYVSQWFLSFFAVTCPLPMLFRVYDVIFAEGASETIMRVALSLMRKNEARLLACPEMEDVMQLLLSRGLWDCYHYNADEFVHDFASLSSVVTRETMQQLEQGYLDSKAAATSPGRGSEVTTAASRFLGRIWTNNKSTNLSPGHNAPVRPSNMLRRSTSKQSIASTLNSIEASSASVASSTSTDATTVTRDSANTEDSIARESTPVGTRSMGGYKNADERNLHGQIEDLLMALSELQRNHALLSNQLQHEREERHEDRKAVQSLLDGLRQKVGGKSSAADVGSPQVDVSSVAQSGDLDNDETPTSSADTVDTADKPAEEDETAKEKTLSVEDLSGLLDMVECRFQSEQGKRRSSMLQTKAQLRDDLSHVKDQLASSMSQSQEYSRQVHALNQEMASVKEQLRESHVHVRALHQDKQRLEKTMQGLKSRASCSSTHEASKEAVPKRMSKASAGGLREFKLGRSNSTPSHQEPEPTTTTKFSKRVSSLPRTHESSVPLVTTTAPVPSPSEHENLLLELVQAKTAEAMAKQEAEESRQKLEALRKIHGLSHHGGSSHGPSASQSGSGVFSMLSGNGSGHGTPSANEANKPAASTGAAAASGGGFWGWRR